MTRGRKIEVCQRETMVAMKKKGMSEREIAELMNIPKTSVHNILHQFKKTGSIKPKRLPGRKPIVTPRDETYHLRLAVAHRRESMPTIAALWNEATGKSICVRICARTLNRMGYKSYAAKKKPAL